MIIGAQRAREPGGQMIMRAPMAFQMSKTVWTNYISFKAGEGEGPCSLGFRRAARVSVLLVVGLSGEEDPELLTQLGLTRDALRAWGVEISPDDITAAKNCTSVEDDIINPAKEAGARRFPCDNMLSAAQWVARPPPKRRYYEIETKTDARFSFVDFQTQGEMAEFGNLARILRAPMYTGANGLLPGESWRTDKSMRYRAGESPQEVAGREGRYDITWRVAFFDHAVDDETKTRVLEVVVQAAGPQNRAEAIRFARLVMEAAYLRVVSVNPRTNAPSTAAEASQAVAALLPA